MTVADVPVTALDDDGPSSTLRVAVVGSGPAGFFTAGAVLKAFPGTTVNMFERLPTPWGLLRAGIAPDHENMRVLGPIFDKTAQLPGFTLRANVDVGSDISHEELLDHHHAVVYATGAQHGRRLGLPGETLSNVFAASDIVGWYNGHPDFVDVKPDLSHERVVVVGNGNVALDVARMLSRDVEELRTTDTADHALAALARSQVKEVVVLGRRGPREAAFTLPELLELEKVAGVAVTVDLGGIEPITPDPDSPTTEDRKLRLLLDMASRAVPVDSGIRHIRLRFMTQPIALSGENGVSQVATAPSVLDESGRVGTGDARSAIQAGLVVTAVGFGSSPVPGVPFDSLTRRIPSLDSQVVDPLTGDRIHGTYVVGWVKRGPSGVLGTNKKCASETLASLQADLAAGLLTREVLGDDALSALLTARCSPVDFTGWQNIDSFERGRGADQGRPRVKLVTRTDLEAAAVKGHRAASALASEGQTEQ